MAGERAREPVREPVADFPLLCALGLWGAVLLIAVGLIADSGRLAVGPTRAPVTRPRVVSVPGWRTTAPRRGKRDRQMVELLNELRVALPGVQILFAFLLTVPFSQGFGELNSFQRNVYFATLLATTLSTACLIAPTATHRLRFHKRDRS